MWIILNYYYCYIYIDSSVCSGEFFKKRVMLIIFILYIGFGMSESNDGGSNSCTNMKSKTGVFFLVYPN